MFPVSDDLTEIKCSARFVRVLYVTHVTVNQYLAECCVGIWIFFFLPLIRLCWTDVTVKWIQQNKHIISTQMWLLEMERLHETEEWQGRLYCLLQNGEVVFRLQSIWSVFGCRQTQAESSEELNVSKVVSKFLLSNQVSADLCLYMTQIAGY